MNEPARLDQTGSAAAAHARRADLPRTIGFWAAIGIMLGVTIGSGIFRTPPEIAQHLSSNWQVAMFWAAGGLLSLLGALTYAELATIFPRSGGLFNYLAEGLGRAGKPIAFTFGWTYMILTKPLAAAGIAIVCVEYFYVLIGQPPEATPGPLSRNSVSVYALLTILTLISLPGMRFSSGVSLVLTVIKFTALSSIIVLGLTISVDHSTLVPAATSAQPATASDQAVFPTLLFAIAPVMAAVLWTYDGWSDIGSVAGEVHKPQKLLPRIFIVGTILITVMYVLANLAFLRAVPIEEMRTLGPNMASTAMTRWIGPSGASIVTAMIVISTLGASQAAVMTGARVTFAQARDGLLFARLAHIHPRFKTPDVSLWVQLVFSCACMAFFQSFNNLAGGFVFTMWIFYGIAGFAVFVLRVQKPDLERPFRCPGYPVVPALFVLSALGMTALNFTGGWEQTKNSLIWLGVLMAGLPAYFVWQRAAGSASGLQTPQA